MEQPELEEHLPSGSETSTGAVGGLVLVEADSVKLPTVDQAETLVVTDASLACTRQYHVPLVRVGV